MFNIQFIVFINVYQNEDIKIINTHYLKECTPIQCSQYALSDEGNQIHTDNQSSHQDEKAHIGQDPARSGYAL